MNVALEIPEILDYILQQAEPSCQAIAAQTCQRWSCRALGFLWRDLPSYFPLLQVLSPLTCVDGEWVSGNRLSLKLAPHSPFIQHFTADLSYGAKWGRFDTYATRVRIMSYDDRNDFQGHKALPSSQLFSEIFLYRPSPNIPILPNLATLRWDSYNSHSVVQLLPFLSPTVTSLEINCHAPMGDTCAKLLRSVTSRSPCLDEFMLSVAGPGENYMSSLSGFLETQRGLLRASLPTASATSEVVKTLATLPLLREYTGWGDVEYQDPIHLGMEFDWGPESFEALEELGFHAASLTAASKIMAKRGGPVLKRLFLSCLSTFEPTELMRLSSMLSISHPNLTLVRLSLYSHSDDPRPSNPINFESIRPLLQCTTLAFLMLWHNETLAYTEEDVAMMGMAWPNMESLELCLDPTNDIGYRTGQPMRIIGTFLRAFPKLEELGVYINEAAAIPDTLEPSVGLVPSRFRVLDFGTSPGARPDKLDRADEIAMYLASVCPPGVAIYNSQTVSHIRNLRVTDEQGNEYERRSVYWEDIAHKVKLIHMGMRYMASGMRGTASN